MKRFLKSLKKNKYKYMSVLFLIPLIFICSIVFKEVSRYVYIDIDEIVNNNATKYLDENELSDYNEDKFKDIVPVYYENFYDAVFNAKSFPTNFTGKLTHYGPDCYGCSGRVACTGQDVRNGNIYYNDKEYGKIRIVAADRSIPCGSIIRINIDEYNYMYTIVLDRGGIIKGARIDLLKVKGKTKSPVRTVNNASFDIIRMGYAK